MKIVKKLFFFQFSRQKSFTFASRSCYIIEALTDVLILAHQ